LLRAMLFSGLALLLAIGVQLHGGLVLAG